MLKGSYVALVTPFKNNKIDFSALRKLIKFHITNKTDGILLCGTTGESPALSSEERFSLLEFCTKEIDHDVKIMIGTGTNNLEHTIELTKQAEYFNADYALVITPYYNKPTQSGLYHYFKNIHNNTNIPLVIYNVPGRTGVNISSSTISLLANECERIIGIKEASGNIFQSSEIIRDTDDNFSLMSGEDALNWPLLAIGAKGVISVTANLLPKKLHNLVKFSEQKKINEANKLHLELLDINNKMFLETNPIPVKTALNLINMISDEIRLPLYKMSQSNIESLSECLKRYHLISEKK
jgi:4-hydroxy-tetrahydrodipicolinate synthase